MGAWGVAILSDDTASDVHATYIDKHNDGIDHGAIRKALEEDFAESLDDEDDGPVFWFALALAQWQCGVLEPDVHARVSELIASGSTLERWQEEGAARARKRQHVLDSFLEKISQPNPKPRRPRKVKHRPAIYQPGDCLAIKLEDGDYGAALVLVARELSKATEWNLVVVLQYKSPEKPSLSVFEQRQWLYPTSHWHTGDEPDMCWCYPNRFKKEGTALEKIGQIAVREDDVREDDISKVNSYGSWAFLGNDFMLQDRWDRGERG